MSVAAIIPARYASTRLPGKPLLDIAGRPMIQHVYERAASCPVIDRCIVATDDRRILDAVHAFGGEALLTRADHATGTDRLAEVAANLEADVVVNVQGDEPLIAPEAIAAAVQPLLDRSDVAMTTLREALTDPADLANPNVVKVVCDTLGFALYFSRSAIPYVRNDLGGTHYWRHVGLYAYRRDFLLEFAKLPPSPLSLAESLEQLRALEHGARIYCAETSYPSFGVDTEADLLRVRDLLAR